VLVKLTEFSLFPAVKYPTPYVCSGSGVGVKCIQKLQYKGADVWRWILHSWE
jgi:hypothetical protein